MHGDKVSRGKRNNFLEWVEAIYDHSDSPIKQIPLSNRDDMFALVDKEFYDTIIKMGRWSLDVRGNVNITVKSDSGGYTSRKMSHFITYVPPNHETTYIDGDRLNNTYENILVLPRGGASRLKSPKKSKYKGVYYREEGDSWYGKLYYMGHEIYLGSFSSEIACANSYNHQARAMLLDESFLNDVPYMSPEDCENHVLKSHIRGKGY